MTPKKKSTKPVATKILPEEIIEEIQVVAKKEAKENIVKPKLTLEEIEANYRKSGFSQADIERIMKVHQKK
jgi:hypothetical protein